MKIKLFEGKDGWRWRFEEKGRITADSEAFHSESNAVRAAKAVVKSVLKPTLKAAGVEKYKVVFSRNEDVLDWTVELVEDTSPEE